MSEGNIHFMERLLGKNWRTTFWAIVSGVAGFLAYAPTTLEPLPDYWENLVRNVLAFLSLAGVIKFGHSTADLKTSKEANQALKQELKQENGDRKQENSDRKQEANEMKQEIKEIKSHEKF